MGTENLIKLAEFLETDPRPQNHFNISSYAYFGPLGCYAVNPLEELMNPSCGTTACALGWCPVVFPDSWRCDSDGTPSPPKSEEERYHPRMCEFFGVSEPVLFSLFYPTDSSSPVYTPAYVASALRRAAAGSTAPSEIYPHR